MHSDRCAWTLSWNLPCADLHLEAPGYTDFTDSGRCQLEATLQDDTTHPGPRYRCSLAQGRYTISDSTDGLCLQSELQAVLNGSQRGSNPQPYGYEPNALTLFCTGCFEVVNARGGGEKNDPPPLKSPKMIESLQNFAKT